RERGRAGAGGQGVAAACVGARARADAEGARRSRHPGRGALRARSRRLRRPHAWRHGVAHARGRARPGCANTRVRATRRWPPPSQQMRNDARTPALARLLQLASPALPVGAYSYSQGLEAAVETGIVRDAASAERWVADVLEL